MKKLPNSLEIAFAQTLDQSQKLALCRAIVSYGKEAPPEEEAMRVFEWAHRTVVTHATLGLVLRGEVEIRIREDGELVFYPFKNRQAN
jgi:hypothetical protein